MSVYVCAICTCELSLTVAVGRPPVSYDLLWPVGRPPGGESGGAVVRPVGDEGEAVVNEPGEFGGSICAFVVSYFWGRIDGSLKEVQEYARRLLGDGGLLELEDEEDERESGGVVGCREGVDLLTRNFKKGACVLCFSSFLPSWCPDSVV